jgi:hypothetical protein
LPFRPTFCKLKTTSPARVKIDSFQVHSWTAGPQRHYFPLAAVSDSEHSTRVRRAILIAAWTSISRCTMGAEARLLLWLFQETSPWILKLHSLVKDKAAPKEDKLTGSRSHSQSPEMPPTDDLSIYGLHACQIGSTETATATGTQPAPPSNSNVEHSQQDASPLTLNAPLHFARFSHFHRRCWNAEMQARG